MTNYAVRAAVMALVVTACSRGPQRESAEAGASVSAASSASTPASATATATATATAAAAIVPAGTTITVYKSPTCGCCGKWEDHMRAAGFTVASVPTNDLDAVKRTHAIALDKQSCHTGIVNGYIVEGHVPAADVARLLAEKPDIRGIAVPGMPAGSPGMEGAWRDAYDVVTLPKSGASTIWSRH